MRTWRFLTAMAGGVATCLGSAGAGFAEEPEQNQAVRGAVQMPSPALQERVEGQPPGDLPRGATQVPGDAHRMTPEPAEAVACERPCFVVQVAGVTADRDVEQARVNGVPRGAYQIEPRRFD